MLKAGGVEELAVACDVSNTANSGALPLVTGDTWPGETGEQGIAVVLTLMTGVDLEMGLLVVELMMGSDWGLGCGGSEASRALTLLTGATWPGVTCWVEKRGWDALTLLTGVTRRGVTCWVEKRTLTLLTVVTRRGVTCWVEKHGVMATPGIGCGPGSTLPEAMLLPLPVLKCGCVKGASRWDG